MTRVLLFSASAKPGGAERAFAGLARTLPGERFEPIAVLGEPGPLETWLEQVGCRVRRVEPTAAEVARVVRETAAVAVVSNKSSGHRVGGAAADAAGVPGIWWQQDVAGARPAHEAAALVAAAAVVCGSAFAAAAQRLFTPGLRVATVPLGIRVDAVAAHRGRGAAVRRGLGWSDRPTVGIVGRLDRWKGQETFLRAAALLAARRPELRFAVVGGAILGTEGAYPDELRRLARELGLADAVHFTGHRHDVHDWQDALDVVVHGSHAEPFGLVVLEAMALAKPLVAAAEGGPSEIVEDGRSGLLVPPGDPVALAGALARILDDDALAARLAAGAADRARAFTEERTAAGFAAVLREVLGAQSTGAADASSAETGGRAGLVRTRGRRST